MRVTHTDSGVAGFATITALLGHDPLARQLWAARPMTRHGHPLERCASLGAALRLLLARDELRARLVYFELDPAVPDVTLVWDRGSRVAFAPFVTPRLYRRRVANVADELGYRRCRLPASSLDKIAAMLGDEDNA